MLPSTQTPHAMSIACAQTTVHSLHPALTHTHAFFLAPALPLNPLDPHRVFINTIVDTPPCSIGNGHIVYVVA
jgi:hypothetical protein